MRTLFFLIIYPQMISTTQKSLSEYLYQFMLPQRAESFKRALNNRTRYVSIILEDLFQHQNYSAVLRSCECFGIQDVHVIENRNKFSLNPDVVMGANKWLDVHQHKITQDFPLENCINRLKEQGYRIVATTPEPNAIPINDLEITQSPIAIVFGTELTGISKEMKILADEFVTIPMYGLTASLNISVSAAIVLQNITARMRMEVKNWGLSTKEIEILEIEWLTKSLKRADLIKNYYLRDSLEK